MLFQTPSCPQGDLEVSEAVGEGWWEPNECQVQDNLYIVESVGLCWEDWLNLWESAEGHRQDPLLGGTWRGL
jgi:hypothetical protein